MITTFGLLVIMIVSAVFAGLILLPVLEIMDCHSYQKSRKRRKVI